MRLISTTDLNYNSNDSFIQSSITLMEDRCLYFVVLVEKIFGDSNHEEVTIVGKPTTERLKAEFTYKDNGGIIKENESHVRMYDSVTGIG